MQATAGALAIIQKEYQTIFCLQMPELLVESEPKLTLLKNGLKKQHPMSELFTYGSTETEAVLFPAHYNPKLVLRDSAT